MPPTSVYPEQLRLVPGISREDASAGFDFTDAVPAGTNYLTLQAIGGPLYIKVGVSTTPTPTDFDFMLPENESIDFCLSDYSLLNVFGTYFCCLCWGRP